MNWGNRRAFSRQSFLLSIEGRSVTLGHVSQWNTWPAETPCLPLTSASYRENPAHVPLVLEIVTGPDQGKSFPLNGELLHLGRGNDNTIILTDQGIGDFHVSIACQSGQLSLYANVQDQVKVGDHFLPGQQWVAVPAQAVVHLSSQTQARVVECAAPAEPTLASTGDRRRAIPRKESKRQVARPVTSRSTTPAVQFGADGKFPELALVAGIAPKTPPQRPRAANPALLFIILAASCLSSAGLLLVEFESSQTTSNASQAQVRLDLAEFYGNDSANLEPYQKFLRRAAVEYSQGHRAAERQQLKQVLSLLNSVDATNPENLNGLTGRQTGKGKATDHKLRTLLHQLLN